MGALTSRQHAGVEELDIQANAVYRYPPKTGNYFASHFIMGGEKFETSTPEGYLFGENTDLNFLGNRPVPFPYPAPPPHEPVKTIRSLVNIRKDSLRLVRITDEAETPDGDSLKSKFSYNVEFVFDSDVQVAITIYYQATEEFHNGIIMYTAKHHLRQSETVLCKGGVSQLFSQTSHVIDPSEWNPEELTFDLERDVYPMVIHAVVTEGEEYIGHSHVLLATFDKHTDGSFFVKPLKQKQVVDGVSYLLQEIYGIENKGSVQELKTCEDDISDNSTECVVCLSDIRDTLILPCRHLCLCSACADTLRYQANNCPICRLPFRALLQIRAMRRKSCSVAAVSYSPVLASQSSDNDERTSCEQVHMGYEVMSLLEALNGPLSLSMPAGPPPVAHEGNFPSLPSSSSLPSSLPVSPAGSLSRSGSRDSTRKKLTPNPVRLPASPFAGPDDRARDHLRADLDWQQVLEDMFHGDLGGLGEFELSPPLTPESGGGGRGRRAGRRPHDPRPPHRPPVRQQQQQLSQPPLGLDEELALAVSSLRHPWEEIHDDDLLMGGAVSLAEVLDFSDGFSENLSQWDSSEASQ
ncbi:unnamed protein product [Lampetra planeri]